MQTDSWVKQEKDNYSIQVVNQSEDELYTQLMRDNKNSSFYVYDYSKTKKNYISLREKLPNTPLFFDVKVNNDLALLSQLTSFQMAFNCFNLHEAMVIRKYNTTCQISITNSLLNEIEMSQLPSVNITYIRIGSINQVDLVKKYLPNVKVIIDISKTRLGVNVYQADAILKNCKINQLEVTGIYTDEKTLDIIDKLTGFYTELFHKEGHVFQHLFIDEVLMMKESHEVNLREKLIINVNQSICRNYLTCFDWIIQTKMNDEKKKMHYHVLNLEFINGIYFEDQESFIPSLRNIKEEERNYLMSIYGPTCDGFNFLVKDYAFKKLDDKDMNYIIIENIGCNSLIFGGSKFNGFDFSNHTIVHRIFNENIIQV